MRRQLLLLLLRSLQAQILEAVNRRAGQALVIIVVESFGLVVVVILPAAGATGSTGSISAVEGALVRVYIGQLVGASSFDCRGRVGDEVVTEVCEGTLHFCLSSWGAARALVML